MQCSMYAYLHLCIYIIITYNIQYIYIYDIYYFYTYAKDPQFFCRRFSPNESISKTMPDPEDSGGVGDAQHGVRRMMSCF